MITNNEKIEKAAKLLTLIASEVRNEGDLDSAILILIAAETIRANPDKFLEKLAKFEVDVDLEIQRLVLWEKDDDY